MRKKLVQVRSIKFRLRVLQLHLSTHFQKIGKFNKHYSCEYFSRSPKRNCCLVPRPIEVFPVPVFRGRHPRNHPSDPFARWRREPFNPTLPSRPQQATATKQQENPKPDRTPQLATRNHPITGLPHLSQNFFLSLLPFS